MSRAFLVRPLTGGRGGGGDCKVPCTNGKPMTLSQHKYRIRLSNIVITYNSRPINVVKTYSPRPINVATTHTPRPINIVTSYRPKTRPIIVVTIYRPTPRPINVRIYRPTLSRKMSSQYRDLGR